MPNPPGPESTRPDPVPAGSTVVSDPAFRLKNQFGTAWQRSTAWAVPFYIWAGWRVGLGLLAFWAGALVPAIARQGTAPYTPAGLNQFTERLLGVWSHWDGEWFLYVAQVGYRSGEFTTPFFPFFPGLVRLVGLVLGGNYLLAAVLVSAVSSLIAFILLYELVRFDFDEPTARHTILYLAAFPTSFFLAACYSESLFVALALGAFLAGRKYRRWGLTGLLIGLAALTRNIGILLLLPLSWEWWRHYRGGTTSTSLGQWRLQWGRWRTLRPLSGFALLLAPLALLGGWLLFNAIALGDPLNFATVQSTPMWNRHFSWPWETVGRAFEVVLGRGPLDGAVPARYREDPNLTDLLFWLFLTVLFGLACWQGWRRHLPFSYLLYFALTVALPLFSPAGKEPLLSYPRFALLAFPAFIVLARLGGRWQLLHYLYLWSAGMLLALLLARFANWYWVG